jgi:hypothetical protein
LATVDAFPDDATLEAHLKACYKDSKKHLIEDGILDKRDQTKILNAETRKIVRFFPLSLTVS